MTTARAGFANLFPATSEVSSLKEFMDSLLYYCMMLHRWCLQHHRGWS
jgi:hypothetical protein